MSRYNVSSLEEIAALFKQRSAKATAEAERTPHKLQMAVLSREANTWFAAAEILRQTTLTAPAAPAPRYIVRRTLTAEHVRGATVEYLHDGANDVWLTDIHAAQRFDTEFMADAKAREANPPAHGWAMVIPA